MYRRRHHCRMCGQVFCNQCSSYYIERDDATQARACRLCYEQLGQSFMENRQAQKRRITSKRYPDLSHLTETAREDRERSISSSEAKQPQAILPTMPSLDGTVRLFETPESRDRHVGNLQSRASQHLESIVDLLVRTAPNIGADQEAVWKGIIVQLVREVVAFVDPDVRAGDSLDIRPYVKLKIIPGGSLQDNAFVNGVVFRKNVAHKKMSSPRTNPRILLLGGGIDFQREDFRLSSLETLIEQEDRYTEILVEKILTLKPNVILVGRSVARRAQEILCENNVVVLQSVKATLLERIARMTGAIVLPSTDHMIQQYGEECLGSCEKFYLRKIIDCEWDEFMPKKRSTPLKRITKDQQGVTYAYLEGCPAELGGTIIIRGGSRKLLSEVKRIISFGIMLAYHLRLEVSYYTDRY
jgi:1-phosphatidylinositol-3-phosphate 5-kinase